MTNIPSAAPEGASKRSAKEVMKKFSTKNLFRHFTNKTTIEGIVIIPIKKGYDYLFDAVKLRKVDPLSNQKAVWETLWASLMINIPL